MWEWLKKWLNRGKQSENKLFKLVSNPDYIYFGYGYLPSTIDHGPIYFRLRRTLGSTDPVLSAGVPPRRALLRELLAAERREVLRECWAAILGGTSTHTIHFGWKSDQTGHCHDVFYVPLNFSRKGHSADALARAFGDYLLTAITEFGRTEDICPSKRAREQTVLFWFGLAIHRYARIVHPGKVR